MKKTAVAAALVLLSAAGLSACSSPLSTADTCVELRAVVVSFPSDGEPTEEDLDEVSGQFRDLAKKSSDTLKDDIETAGEIISRGWDGPAPTEEESEALDRLEEICDLGNVG